MAEPATSVSCEGSFPNVMAPADVSDEGRTFKKDLVRAPSSSTTTASNTPMTHYYNDYPYDGSLVSVQSIAEQITEAVPAYLSPLALLMT